MGVFLMFNCFYWEGTLKKLLVLSALFAALLFFACGEKKDSSAPAKDAEATVESAAQETAPVAEDEVAADEEGSQE
jgi:predicted small lipoprotein YifL